MSQMASNTAQIRFWNKQRIKEALRSLTCGTKNSVAKMTGLSVATCNTLLNELALTGEIQELEMIPAEENCVGRPAKNYCFNEDFAAICSLCLYFENGKRRVSYSIRNLNNKVIYEGSIYKDLVNTQVLIGLVADLMTQHPRIAGIGVGIPGIVNKDGSIDVCDMEELSGCALLKELELHFGMPVSVENDMNLIAYGLYQKEKDTEGILAAISFFRKNLPGTGIIIEGNILRGKSNFAGEVSYLPLGCDREKQLITYKNKSAAAIQLIGTTLACITAVLNPDTIVLTGEMVEPTALPDIETIVQQSIPVRHMPRIIYVADADRYYHQGNAAIIMQRIETHTNRRFDA